jgi:hypothetical protein
LNIGHIMIGLVLKAYIRGLEAAVEYIDGS